MKLPLQVKLFQESYTAALKAIAKHGMRSFLTMLGIIIGVCSVIIVASLMDRLSDKVNHQIKDLGTDSVTLSAKTSTEQEMLGLINKISYDDYLWLKNKVNEVEVMSARMRAFSLGGDVSFGRNQTQTQIIGTESNYQLAVKVYPEYGRFLRTEDDVKRRRVVFIGQSLADKLKFTPVNIGDFLKVEGEWFRVIGIAEARGTLFGLDQDNFLYMPLATAKTLLGQEATDDIEIVFIPKSSDTLKSLLERITHLMRAKHKLNGDQKDFFEFETAKKTKEQFSEITQTITLVAIGVVGVSLIVGGIGIMNIMLVSVTERTKEVGIAKALGAKPSFILSQFLLEAVILATMGSIIGLALGATISAIIGTIIGAANPAHIPLWAIVLSMGFTTSIGVIFGFAPALKASKLNPIDALRFE
tara:strand:- start:11538 stop:12782 length:1245 start_codon:yes stop_codon:yes gene_type:complete